MTDEEVRLEQDDAPENETLVRRLSTILLLAIVIIAIVLLWRSCDTDDTSAAADTTTEKSIGTIEGLEPSPGDVTVWLRDGVAIEDVLARHNLSTDGVIEFPGGTTFSIPIGDADPEAVVAELKQDPDLYDAGYLFVDE